MSSTIELQFSDQQHNSILSHRPMKKIMVYGFLSLLKFISVAQNAADEIISPELKIDTVSYYNSPYRIIKSGDSTTYFIDKKQVSEEEFTKFNATL